MTTINLVQATLLTDLENIPIHTVDPTGDGIKQMLLDRPTVLALVKDHFQESATLERGLNVLARREAALTFGPGFVKVKFANCPSFTADTLNNALDIAIRLTDYEGGAS